jgi:hypothetical protein
MSKPKTKTAKNPTTITKPGRYGFGGGLWLTVTPTGGRAWSFRFTIAGRSRALGLGGFPLVSLEQARAKAAEARQLARQGVDPIEARNGCRRPQGARHAVQGGRRGAYRRPSPWLAESKILAAMAGFPGRLRLSSARLEGRGGDNQGGRGGRAAPDLDDEARDRQTATRPHRANPESRHGARFARGRQPGGLELNATFVAGGLEQDTPPCGAALCRVANVPSPAARGRWRCGAGGGIHDSGSE